ncbi:MAG: hypothetical protein QOE93_1679 [Actinomycetota bacterium]|jgi:hypothetical protein|nr:hypothetical protein [Actinomycetota bacterium]
MPSAPAPNPAAMVPELGMRRVRWVRISISDTGVKAHVAGIAHRFPIIRPVSLNWANTLIRAGCPYVVRDERRTAGAGAGAPAQAG